MNLLQPLTAGLFDPSLQLEAEARPLPQSHYLPCLGVVDIHGEIVQTIAAIDRLAWQLRPTGVGGQSAVLH